MDSKAGLRAGAVRGANGLRIEVKLYDLEGKKARHEVVDLAGVVGRGDAEALFDAMMNESRKAVKLSAHIEARRAALAERGIV